MSLDSGLQPSPEPPSSCSTAPVPELPWHWRWAIGLWVFMLAVLIGLVLYKPHSPSLNLLWREAGRCWGNAEDVYKDGFRYGPLVAALLTPLSWMPLALSAILVRLANAAVLLAGTVAWLRHAAPGKLDLAQRSAFFILLGLFSLSNLEVGQFNPMVIGLLLGALAATQRQRWSLAAGLLAFASVLKIYPLAFAVLMLTVYPRQLAARLVIALLAALALPFAMQDPHYVVRQYECWLVLIRAADTYRRFMPMEASETYRDLLYLFRLYGIPINLRVYTVLQGLCGLGCALLCMKLVRAGATQRRIGWRVLVLGTVWLTVCGPASEPRTYGILAPVLAWCVVWTWKHGPQLAGWLAGNACGVQLLCMLSSVSAHSVLYFRCAGLHPISALFLLGSYWAADPLMEASSGEKSDQHSVPLPHPELAPLHPANRVA